jgi:hypothetical protein
MMAGAMLIAGAMPDRDQAAKVIDSALESALESVGEYRRCNHPHLAPGFAKIMR